MKNYLIFDTETTGLPVKGKPFDHPDQPEVVQFAAQVVREDKKVLHAVSLLVLPHKKISEGATKVHGITDELVEKVGIRTATLVDTWLVLLNRADSIVAHNIAYDLPIMNALLSKSGYVPEAVLFGRPQYCTMKTLTPICKIPSKWGGYKWPTLAEAYRFCFDEEIKNAHDAMGDVKATTDIFFNLLGEGLING